MNILRKFLLPFSLIYWFITGIRNKLYDFGILQSTSFSTPVITIGNLSVGGTGKTPMIEYLIGLLLPQYSTATLSRGYGRKTKGFYLLKGNETAEIAGDEPLQFKLKYPDAIVAVDENRRRGIKKIINVFSPEVILLDDAFQHRRVKAGLNILLSTYEDLFISDFILPAGNLRETAGGAKRADIIVITKCPPDLSQVEELEIKRELRLSESQQVYFSFINYSSEIINTNHSLPLNEILFKEVLLITGIANPKPLVNFLKKSEVVFEHKNFPDHHNFSEKDIKRFLEAEFVLTTEKDFMRLRDKVNHPNLYYIPIRSEFLSEGSNFDLTIKNFVNKK